MGEQRIFNRPDKDFRAMYANTFIADLKEYAGKHNLDIFVKEYEVNNEWEHCGDLYRNKEFHVAAIMFSGIVSKINNLEYIIQYDSTRSRVEFLMMSPKFRENCQAGDTDTIRYPSLTGVDYDLLFGKEFRPLHNEINANDELCHLKHLDSNAKHISGLAIDMFFEGIHKTEAKHERCLENRKSLEKKKIRLKTAEDNMLDITKDFNRKFTARSIMPVMPDAVKVHSEINASKKYPMSATLRIPTSNERSRIEVVLNYKPNRCEYNATVSVYEVVGEGTPVEDSVLRITDTHWGIISFCGERFNWVVTGGIEKVVDAVCYAIKALDEYEKTTERMRDLRQQFGIPAPESRYDAELREFYSKRH